MTDLPESLRVKPNIPWESQSLLLDRTGGKCLRLRQRQGRG
jgi:hypothetical protein